MQWNIHQKMENTYCLFISLPHRMLQILQYASAGIHSVVIACNLLEDNANDSSKKILWNWLKWNMISEWEKEDFNRKFLYWYCLVLYQIICTFHLKYYYNERNLFGTTAKDIIIFFMRALTIFLLKLSSSYTAYQQGPALFASLLFSNTFL